MRHRVFIAINLPENIRRELVKFQYEWPEIPVKWTKPENLHITLAFLGNLSDEEVATVCQITEDVASKNQPFSINLNKICYGPPKKMPPRMVWVVGKKSAKLTKLKNDLEDVLATGSRYKRETRPFSPHITLGRIRKWDFRRIEPEDRPQVETDLSLSFEVTSIEVMESFLKRGGAEYTILMSAQLTSENPKQK